MKCRTIGKLSLIVETIMDVFWPAFSLWIIGNSELDGDDVEAGREVSQHRQPTSVIAETLGDSAERELVAKNPCQQSRA